MQITIKRLKQIIKEELSEAFAGGDYGSVKDRKSDNYHAVSMELRHGMGIPEEDVTDELIMTILRHPRYSDGDSIDAGARSTPPGYGFSRQDIYDLKRQTELREVDMGGEDPPTMGDVKYGYEKAYKEQDKIEDLAENALWYYKNQKGGGLRDLKIIASGKPMPDVVRISQEEAMHIVVVAEALKKAGVKNDLQEEDDNALQEGQDANIEGTRLMSIKQLSQASDITSNVLRSLNPKEKGPNIRREKIYNVNKGRMIAVRTLNDASGADIYLGKDTDEHEAALRKLGYVRVLDLHVP